jgi:hypothetical protein
MTDVFSAWESLLRGAMVLLGIFWMRSGIKAAMKKAEMQNRIWQYKLCLWVLWGYFLCLMV